MSTNVVALKPRRIKESVMEQVLIDDETLKQLSREVDSNKITKSTQNMSTKTKTLIGALASVASSIASHRLGVGPTQVTYARWIYEDGTHWNAVKNGKLSIGGAIEILRPSYKKAKETRRKEITKAKPKPIPKKLREHVLQNTKKVFEGLSHLSEASNVVNVLQSLPSNHPLRKTVSTKLNNLASWLRSFQNEYQSYEDNVIQRDGQHGSSIAYNDCNTRNGPEVVGHQRSSGSQQVSEQSPDQNTCEDSSKDSK